VLNSLGRRGAWSLLGNSTCNWDKGAEMALVWGIVMVAGVAERHRSCL
jgi:hypothetical protein